MNAEQRKEVDERFDKFFMYYIDHAIDEKGRLVEVSCNLVKEFIHILLDEKDNTINAMQWDVEKLRCLENAGVDNWEGYSCAMQEIEKEQEEETK